MAREYVVGAGDQPVAVGVSRRAVNSFFGIVLVVGDDRGRGFAFSWIGSAAPTGRPVRATVYWMDVEWIDDWFPWGSAAFFRFGIGVFQEPGFSNQTCADPGRSVLSPRGPAKRGEVGRIAGHTNSCEACQLSRAGAVDRCDHGGSRNSQSLRELTVTYSRACCSILGVQEIGDWLLLDAGGGKII